MRGAGDARAAGARVGALAGRPKAVLRAAKKMGMALVVVVGVALLCGKPRWALAASHACCTTDYAPVDCSGDNKGVVYENSSYYCIPTSGDLCFHCLLSRGVNAGDCSECCTDSWSMCSDQLGDWALSVIIFVSACCCCTTVLAFTERRRRRKGLTLREAYLSSIPMVSARVAGGGGSEGEDGSGLAHEKMPVAILASTIDVEVADPVMGEHTPLLIADPEGDPHGIPPSLEEADDEASLLHVRVGGPPTVPVSPPSSPQPRTATDDLNEMDIESMPVNPAPEIVGVGALAEPPRRGAGNPVLEDELVSPAVAPPTGGGRGGPATAPASGDGHVSGTITATAAGTTAVASTAPEQEAAGQNKRRRKRKNKRTRGKRGNISRGDTNAGGGSQGGGEDGPIVARSTDQVMEV